MFEDTLYFPFLKAKQFELMSLHRLESNLKEKLFPVFDLPANTHTDSNETIKEKIDKTLRHFNRYGKSLVHGFFYDHFDLDPDLTINNNLNPYEYALSELKDFNAYPIIGLDRTSQHNHIAIKYGLARKKLAFDYL